MRIANITAILGMALVTYLTRIAGFWFAGRLGQSGSLIRRMKYVPCAVLAAIVAPLMAMGGLAEWSGIVVSMLIMILTRNFLLSLVASVLTVVLFR